MCCLQANVMGRALCLPQGEANRIDVEERGKSEPRTQIYIYMYIHLLLHHAGSFVLKQG